MECSLLGKVARSFGNFASSEKGNTAFAKIASPTAEIRALPGIPGSICEAKADLPGEEERAIYTEQGCRMMNGEA